LNLSADFATLTRVENRFDYIIAGGGMAWLSLAFYLNESRLRDKKILIIDRDAKIENDHTWCFWEKKNGAFEEIIFRKWRKIRFHGTRDFSEILDLGEYEYKMIRAADFYKFVLEKLKKNPNFMFLQAEIEQIEGEIVKTKSGEFRAEEFIFDSFTRKTYDNPKYQNLRQHFHGWLIETPDEIFNPNAPTLFDFRVEQKSECRFVYILPFSEKKALIEFTIFSDNLLKKNEYETNLKKYIAEILKAENYKILETEAGAIPMSDEPHDEFPSRKIIRIGTSGGYVKPSTGYSFQRTQCRLKKLVQDLENQIPNPKSQTPNWKSYLDSVLLNVLLTKKHPADDVFTALFAKNKTEQVLKFLDEDTSFAEDLQIMKTVPINAFVKAAAQTAAKKFR
jgi:lycopene beta-cyclase